MAEPVGDERDDGQTPLDPDESEGLLLPVTTRGALNAVEADNIAEAVAWLASRRHPADEVLSEEFVRDLHTRMLGHVWSWAGQYRRTDKNIGVVGVRQVLADADAWIASGMDADEAAVRLGHRMVVVHPFPSGNGRHSRLLSDRLAEALGRPVFSWGARTAAGATARERYIAALRAADQGEIAPLVAFARS